MEEKAESELERMAAVREQSQVIGEFIDWLQHRAGSHVHLMESVSPEVDKRGKAVYRDLDGNIVEDWHEPNLGMVLKNSDEYDKQEDEKTRRGIHRKLVPDMNGEQFLPCRFTIEELLAEFFAIDLDKVEQERRALLEKIRGENP